MSKTDEALLARYEAACRFARQAGELTLDYFQRDNLDVERKGDDSPVTVADRETERLLRELIAAAFPDDAVLGEELGESPGESGFRWILDPIDGTKSFIHGVPLYTTLVGIEHEGRCGAGVIMAPATGEMVHAAVGRGAWFSKGDGEPQRAVVSKVDQLSQALFLTSEVASFRSRPEDATDTFLRLQDACRLTRTWGDAYGYLMVATGRADVMVDPAMSLWDAAALQPVLEEAGGSFTDWRGETTIYNGEGIATNGCLLDEVLAFVRCR